MNHKHDQCRRSAIKVRFVINKSSWYASTVVDYLNLFRPVTIFFQKLIIINTSLAWLGLR